MPSKHGHVVMMIINVIGIMMMVGVVHLRGCLNKRCDNGCDTDYGCKNDRDNDYGCDVMIAKMIMVVVIIEIMVDMVNL